MSRKGFKPTGPTPIELKLRSDLGRTRRDLARLKKANAAAGIAAAPTLAANGEAAGVEEHDIDLLEVDSAKVAQATPAHDPVAANGDVDRQHGPASQSPDTGANGPHGNGGAGSTHAAGSAGGAAHDGPKSAAGDGTEPLAAEIEKLQRAKQRISKLYYTQVEENRKRGAKLHQILESLCDINAGFELETLLSRLADHIRQGLGFHNVLIRLRDPGSRTLRARAYAGLDEKAWVALQSDEITVDAFMGWLKDEFKVSRSYFIGHQHALNAELPRGHSVPLGPREQWEWHPEDILLVPLFSRTGELVGYFSVDDPADRLVPSREIIELLEVYANHAVVAIENARLYLQLERHSRDLEQAGQHMQELHALKSNFVSTVSHELRTPLTAIRAYTETLLNAKPGEMAEAQVQRFLSVINDESQRLARLIESVLDLNRFDSGTAQLTRQAVDLAELLQETAPVLESLAQVGPVRLKLLIDCADTRIEVNRDQMRQLVLHLGSNAVKFTPAGGEVLLRLQGDEHEVSLLVQDTGIGIPGDKIEKIFERFYQVESSLARRFGGSGLGLAICKSIVDWHGGRILAESEEGRGSRFTVVLPRRTLPRVLVRPGPRPQAATEDVLKLAIEMVAEVMNARVVSLLSTEPDEELVIRAAIGLDPEVVQNARIRPGSGVAGWVAENRRPVCVSGLEPRSEIEGSRRRQYRSGTFLSVPLEGASGLLGVLNVTEPLTQKTFDAEDCHLLLHLAQRVASAWEQALEMERSQADVGSTADALREVLRHLERGRRDAPDRVRLSRSVARELKLGESEAGVISYAASIHDVGMGRIGERVVETAGGLTHDDREEVERHPELGAHLLGPLEQVGVVREIVLSHHEWWDGTGYPRGLRQEEIPVGARILAVVDAFESMTVGRAHRPPVTKEEALQELQRLRGRQFDPAVVDAFERALTAAERQPGDAAVSRSSTMPDRG